MDEDRLERSKSRNLLESIDDKAAPPEPWQLRRATATVSIPGEGAPRRCPSLAHGGADVATKAPVASPVALR
jgi:hypothetical protein